MSKQILVDLGAIMKEVDAPPPPLRVSIDGISYEVRPITHEEAKRLAGDPLSDEELAAFMRSIFTSGCPPIIDAITQPITDAKEAEKRVMQLRLILQTIHRRFEEFQSLEARMERSRKLVSESIDRPLGR